MDPERLPFKLLRYMIDRNYGWFKRVNRIFLELDLDIFSNVIACISVANIIERLTQRDSDNWKLNVSSKPKLRTYALFKHDLKTELYVKSLLPKYKRSILCQFRSGVLPLSIETGRYRNVPACERFCEICNSGVIEDETHFLCMCPMFRELKDELYLNVKYLDPSILLDQLTDSEKLIMLMEDRFIKCTANFIFDAWTIRQNIMFC